jgi:hypothetical protein
MQRGEVGQHLQPAHDLGVHEHGRGEIGPSMDDAVAHGIDRAAAGHEFLQRRLVHLASGGREDLCRQELVPLVEHRQLEAARPGIDDKYAHLPRRQ